MGGEEEGGGRWSKRRVAPPVLSGSGQSQSEQVQSMICNSTPNARFENILSINSSFSLSLLERLVEINGGKKVSTAAYLAFALRYPSFSPFTS